MQDLLKEVAQTQQVDLAAKQRFKVVVINEADHLTRDAQAALRRTMEKYSPNLRLILLANSTSNIIAPIRSRTLLVRVAAPSEDEICDVLKSVGQKERFTDVDALNRRIARESGRNLRRALLMYEAVHAQNEVVSEKTPIPPPDWEALISQIADEIMAEHTPARIVQVRAKLYDLLTHCIPATTILKVRRSHRHKLKARADLFTDSYLEANTQDRRCTQAGSCEVVSILRTQNQAWHSRLCLSNCMTSTDTKM